MGQVADRELQVLNRSSSKTCGDDEVVDFGRGGEEIGGTSSDSSGHSERRGLAGGASPCVCVI